MIAQVHVKYCCLYSAPMRSLYILSISVLPPRKVIHQVYDPSTFSVRSRISESPG